MSLTVIVLNHLPVKLLQLTLNSVLFADEVIVVHDSTSILSTPKTRSNFVSFSRPLDNFAAQRNFALKKAKSTWVLFLDSDEVISKKLQNEIKAAIKISDYQAYLLPRQDIILGTTLRYGETGSIKLLRLAQKNAGDYTRFVHEFWDIRSGVGELRSPILHYKKNFAESFIQKITRYGLLDSKELVKESKPFSYFKLLFFPPVKFVHNYIMRRGFQDGTLGVFHAYLMSIQSLSVRVFQWQDSRLSKIC